MFSLYLHLYLQLFTQFKLPYLHLLAYTYLHLLIYTCVLFVLLYELDKIDKIKRRRLKSIASIEDNYLETATGYIL